MNEKDNANKEEEKKKKTRKMKYVIEFDKGFREINKLANERYEMLVNENESEGNKERMNGTKEKENDRKKETK